MTGVGDPARMERSAMGMTRLQPRGQLTVPAKVRQASGLKAGDNLLVRSRGRGVFEVRVLPKFRSVDDLVDKYSVPGKADIDQLRSDMADDMLEEFARKQMHGSVEKEVATERE